MVIILWFIELNPWIGAITLTSDIVWNGTSANNEVSSIISSISGLYTITLGGLKNSLPPSVTFIAVILSKSSILTTGETNASGLNVLSDEYSYPKSTILTSLILPMEVDNATTLAFFPLTLTIEENFGSCL